MRTWTFGHYPFGGINPYRRMRRNTDAGASAAVAASWDHHPLGDPHKIEGSSPPLPGSGLRLSPRSSSGARRDGSCRMPFAGSSVIETTDSGSLKRAMRSAPCSRSSSRLGGSSPLTGTTNATTCCPHSGAGRPATATSATFGWSGSACSTSCGHTVSAPVRMASSDGRRSESPVGLQSPVSPGAQPAVQRERGRRRRGVVAVALHERGAVQLDATVSRRSARSVSSKSRPS